MHLHRYGKSQVFHQTITPDVGLTSNSLAHVSAKRKQCIVVVDDVVVDVVVDDVVDVVVSVVVVVVVELVVVVVVVIVVDVVVVVVVVVGIQYPSQVLFVHLVGSLAPQLISPF